MKKKTIMNSEERMSRQSIENKSFVNSENDDQFMLSENNLIKLDKLTTGSNKNVQ